MAFQKFPTASFNLYSDSRYLVEVLLNLETATLGHTNDNQLFHTFLTLQRLICSHIGPVAVLHIRAHSSLPGTLAEGNLKADSLTKLITFAITDTPAHQAQASHSLHHQSSAILQKQFHIPREAA